MLVMEYMPLGNLMDQDKIQKFCLEETRIFLCQTLQGLTYLHNDEIIHRDIKPENILVQSRTPDLFIKLSDFGLSQRADSLHSFCGTKQYAAPEIYTGRYTNAVDIWSVGVIGCQFVMGLPEFFEKMPPKKWS